MAEFKPNGLIQDAIRQRQELSVRIVDKFKKDGGDINKWRSIYQSDGEAAARDYLISIMGDEDGLKLIDEFDKLPKSLEEIKQKV